MQGLGPSARERKRVCGRQFFACETAGLSGVRHFRRVAVTSVSRVLGRRKGVRLIRRRQPDLHRAPAVRGRPRHNGLRPNDEHERRHSESDECERVAEKGYTFLARTADADRRASCGGDTADARKTGEARTRATRTSSPFQRRRRSEGPFSQEPLQHRYTLECCKASTSRMRRHAVNGLALRAGRM